MRRAHLPISALPAWTKLNDVIFYDTKVDDHGAKGFGFTAGRPLSSAETFDIPTLLSVPKELVLCAESIEEHAKTDKHFRELLGAAGGKSLRGDVLLFLLMQITMTCLETSQNIGVGNPWTEYVRMLPERVPVPTTWTEDQRMLLIGTSLNSALSAKMAALTREFETLREKTLGISWCRVAWWDSDRLDINDWILIDSWYRSRCLELPAAGESMVPCLDMANHSSNANAYYEQSSGSDVVLLLKPEQTINTKDEITISYGAEKSAAEMLFSYGFIDADSSANSLVLDIMPFPDDPLGKAKLAAFSGAPTVTISGTKDSVEWVSPLVYFLCLNEEDGLAFKVLQEVDGTQGGLRVYWEENDVTDATNLFDQLCEHHSMKDVFVLRAVALLQSRLEQQLEQLYSSEAVVNAIADSLVPGVRDSIANPALILRSRELLLLETAYQSLENQKSTLLESPAVVKYLGSMERETEQADTANEEEEEDFS